MEIKKYEDAELLRSEMISYLLEFIGTFYTWGGDDPSSFDCSGLAVEGLKSVGLIKRKTDYTANSLKGIFYAYRVAKPYAGCFAFIINVEGRATHIEVCINHLQTIGASGGGSATKTREDAIRHNAFVKIRPIHEGFKLFIDPFKKLLT